MLIVLRPCYYPSHPPTRLQSVVDITTSNLATLKVQEEIYLIKPIYIRGRDLVCLDCINRGVCQYFTLSCHTVEDEVLVKSPYGSLS